jgi:formiminoglutamase
MQHFNFYKAEHHLAFTKTRPGETKLGEVLPAITNDKRWKDELKKSTSRFVIFGIPEDIGVKANFGTGGTSTAWPAFLAAFLNIQHNTFLVAEDILLLGYFDFSELQKSIENKPAAYMREQVDKIDKQVSALVEQIISSGKIPVVIGGGHNNAYGTIKGAALGLFNAGKQKTTQINIVNLDAHADFRPLEGRHSGNGFSYAMHEGFLKRYSVIGLHENYVTASMLSTLQKNKQIQTFYYDDIEVSRKISFEETLNQASVFTKSGYTGIELDLDAVEQVLSSAMSPSGFSVVQARQYVHFFAAAQKIAYLHICEGASALENGLTAGTTGKLIAFLVTDFIKSSSRK